eukprot:3999426-Pleurochrysis_carterae.AAC.1
MFERILSFEGHLGSARALLGCPHAIVARCPLQFGRNNADHFLVNRSDCAVSAQRLAAEFCPRLRSAAVAEPGARDLLLCFWMEPVRYGYWRAYVSKYLRRMPASARAVTCGRLHPKPWPALDSLDALSLSWYGPVIVLTVSRLESANTALNLDSSEILMSSLRSDA